MSDNNNQLFDNYTDEFNDKFDDLLGETGQYSCTFTPNIETITQTTDSLNASNMCFAKGQ